MLFSFISKTVQILLDVRRIQNSVVEIPRKYTFEYKRENTGQREWNMPKGNKSHSALAPVRCTRVELMGSSLIVCHR